MWTLLIAFAVASVCTLLIVRSAKMHVHRSGDDDFTKPQKFHVVPVPRIGGLAIILGLVAAVATLAVRRQQESAEVGLLLLGCALPAFIAGFIQDFTEAITPRGRLVATGISAALAYYWAGATIEYTTIPGIDWIVGFSIGSLFITVLTVAGVANAINIIDGFNGLASMCVMLMLAAVGYVAIQTNDWVVGMLSIAGVGAVLGFFIWNFPYGLIFLGDGGAYLLGYYVAELSILLLVRNPEVSPLFPLMVCVYPAFETIFSIYRRLVLRQRAPHMPDGIHLHSLVYRRIMRWAVGGRGSKALTRGNSMTSPILWALCMASIVPAVLFWEMTPILAIFLVLYIIIYLTLYWRIVRFRSPRLLLLLGSKRPHRQAANR